MKNGCVFVLAFLLSGNSIQSQTAEHKTNDARELRQQLWKLVNNAATTRQQPLGQLASIPYYRTWNLLPSGPDQPRDEYKNRRLGLPVHGRWITTYVNDLAYRCLTDPNCLPNPGLASLRPMPAGSIIVKENYPNRDLPRYGIDAGDLASGTGDPGGSGSVAERDSG